MHCMHTLPQELVLPIMISYHNLIPANPPPHRLLCTAPKALSRALVCSPLITLCTCTAIRYGPGESYSKWPFWTLTFSTVGDSLETISSTGPRSGTLKMRKYQRSLVPKQKETFEWSCLVRIVVRSVVSSVQSLFEGKLRSMYQKTLSVKARITYFYVCNHTCIILPQTLRDAGQQWAWMQRRFNQ